MNRILVASLTVVSLVMLLRAAESTTAAPGPIAQTLEGVWVQIGEPGNVRSTPRADAPLKFRMSGHWTFTQKDPITGTVEQHFGGTYRAHGNEYIETIDYSTDPDDPELRRTLKFTVSVNGDTMTQIGVGNPYTEVWKRVQ